MEDNKIVLRDNNGSEKYCDELFRKTINNKTYVVYTDYSINSNGIIKVYT